MTKIKRVGLFGVAAIAILAVVLTIKTLTFSPGDIGNGADIKQASLPDINHSGAIKHLSEAIRFETVSHQDPLSNDQSAWQNLHVWLRQTYPAVHQKLTLKRIADHSLIYRWQGSDPDLPPIVLMAHQDVVPVTAGTEKDWKYPPFSGQIADHAVWGRGSVDDKGSLIALFEAVEALVVSGFQPQRTVYLVSGHDEEVGGSGAKAAAEYLAKTEKQILFILDEGAAVVNDEPLTKAPTALIGIAEKGYATLQVTANAPGGHSSTPPERTGVIRLAEALIAINDNSFSLEIQGPTEKMLAVLANKKGGLTKLAVANTWMFDPLLKSKMGKTSSGAALMHTTIAPTMLSGSPKENVLPQSATGLINYRIAPWNQSSDIMAKAKVATKGMGVSLSWVKPPKEPSAISSTNSPGWNMIVATIKSQSPELSIAPYLVVAGTDSYNFQGISKDVYRFMPIRFNIEETKMIHGTNEHMTWDNLKRSINFYAELIATSAG